MSISVYIATSETTEYNNMKPEGALCEWFDKKKKKLHVWSMTIMYLFMRKYYFSMSITEFMI